MELLRERTCELVLRNGRVDIELGYVNIVKLVAILGNTHYSLHVIRKCKRHAETELVVTSEFYALDRSVRKTCVIPKKCLFSLKL